MLQDITFALPLMLASLWSVLLILLEAIIEKPAITKLSAQIGFVAVVLTCVLSPAESHLVFSDMLKTGAFMNYTTGIFALTGLAAISISEKYLQDEHIHYGEFYIVVFLTVIGMILMATGSNLAMLFIGLELMSIALYVLAGLQRKNQRSNEAALKYFLLGAFASGFFLYGLAFLYGETGSLSLSKLSQFYELAAPGNFFWIGFGLVFVGLFFKIGAVPFHQWAPDAYEGSPTPSSGFMATAAKIAAFSTFILFSLQFSHAFSQAEHFKYLLIAISVLSMVFGNLYALGQNNIKRMLAYSSVAHGGYMLVGIAGGNETGLSGVLFYAAIYSATTIGAFGIIQTLERDGRFLEIKQYSGLFKTKPLLAATMSVFMFSMIGLPPLGGFIGKYLVFASAIESGLTWLAIVGVLASLLSVFYYLRIVLVMFLEEPNQDAKLIESATINPVLLILAILTLALGFYPSPIIDMAQQAIALF